MLSNKLQKFITGCSLLTLVVLSGPVFADYTLNLRQGVTPISKDVYDLHMIILWVVTIIGALVFGIMIWSMIHHRKSKGAVPAQFHHNTTAEIVWTIIPIMILVGLAVPATKTLIRMEETSDAHITIKITGHQWKWQYDYLEDGIRFFSVLADDSNKVRQRGSGIDPKSVENYLLEVDQPVVLPVNTKIRLLTTGADVIHAWWVPDLGWKRDAIPGFINDNWTYIEKEGTYRGQCAELCGRDHGFMPIVVNAVSKEKYAAWVEEMKSRSVEIDGAKLYKTNCAVCHQAEGQGIPGTFPALAGSPIVTGPAADHINRVLHGKNMMPAFAKQLSDEELAAIINHERTSWGNDAGTVTADDIKAAR